MKKPMLTVFLKPPFNKTEKGALLIKRAMEYIYLGQAVKYPSIVAYDSHLDTEEEAMIVCTSELFETDENVVSYLQSPHWIIRYELDKDALRGFGLGPKDVANAIKRYMPNIVVQSSEYNMKQWIIRLHLLDLKQMIGHIEEHIDQKDAKKIERDILVDVQNNLLNTVQLSGLPMVSQKQGKKASTSQQQRQQMIRNATVSKLTKTVFDEETGDIREEKEYILYTEGSALQQVLTIPGVDPNRTYSNDIHETAQVLGIEAACAVLFNEVKTVLSFDGTYVNDRHTMLTVAAITANGKLTSMTRHGVHKESGGPLVKSSFEEQDDVLVEAAAEGQIDMCNGVTENIMFGQTVHVGTGAFGVMLDDEYHKVWNCKDRTGKNSITSQNSTARRILESIELKNRRKRRKLLHSNDYDNDAEKKEEEEIIKTVVIEKLPEYFDVATEQDHVDPVNEDDEILDLLDSSDTMDSDAMDTDGDIEPYAPLSPSSFDSSVQDENGEDEWEHVTKEDMIIPVDEYPVTVTLDNNNSVFKGNGQVNYGILSSLLRRLQQ
jgi:hypothetical protein